MKSLAVHVAGVPELDRFVELFEAWGEAVRKPMPGAGRVFDALAREARSELLIKGFFGSYIPPRVLIIQVPELTENELELLSEHFRKAAAGWTDSPAIGRMFGDLAVGYGLALEHRQRGLT